MILSTFKSVSQAYLDRSLDRPWAEMAQYLIVHYDRDTKEAVPLFNLWEFKKVNDPTCEVGRRYHGKEVINDQGKKVWERLLENTYDEIPNTVRRCKENCVSLGGIVLDIDEKMTLEDAMVKFDQYEYVIYTTFRHTAIKNKFRIVTAAYKAAVMVSLRSCSGMHYAGTAGTSNKAVLTLVTICKSVGMTYEEFDPICKSIAHPDSALGSISIRAAAWNQWTGDRIRRETRDNFIAAWGGKAIKVAKANSADALATAILKKRNLK